MENYLVIGDIHGRFDLLEDLLGRCEFHTERHKEKWQLVFLGDYVDRGPDSFKVVAKVQELCEAGKAIALRGNHEDMMIRYAAPRFPDPENIWFYNGGKKTVESYSREYGDYGIGSFLHTFPTSGHEAFLKSLPYYFETDAVWFSHAPIPRREFRKKDDYRTDVDALTWSWNGHYKVTEKDFVMNHGKLAVCGHVHGLQMWDATRDDKWLEPRVYENIIYADTGSGCAPEGPLSAIVITDGKFDAFIQAVPGRHKTQI